MDTHATPPSSRSSSAGRNIGMALVAIAVSVVVSVLGSMATLPNIPTWYAQLDKPWFNPPNWVFGPVWTLLYALLAFAFWRILTLPAGTPGRGGAILLYLVQMTANAAWSWAFFGFQSPMAGLVVIAILWLLIVANMVAFWRLDRLSGWLFVPYIAWVTFAAALNIAIVVING